MKRILLGVLVGLAARPAIAVAQDTTAAVVKIDSPYRDFVERQEFSLVTGSFSGHTGEAGVGPQGAPLIGLGYLVHIGGPASLTGRLTYSPSKRTVLDTAQPPATRNVGTITSPLYMLDVGLQVALPGEKSWHRLVPYAGFAFGTAVGQTSPDAGGYEFGSQFYIAIGVGARYVLKGPWLLRIDAWDYFWQLHYPESYFRAPVGSTPVLPISAPQKEFVGNGLFSVGVSYVFSR